MHELLSVNILLIGLFLFIVYSVTEFLYSVYKWVRWKTIKLCEDQDENPCVDWDLVLKNIEDERLARERYRKPPPDDPPGASKVPVTRPVNPVLTGADAKPFPPEEE